MGALVAWEAGHLARSPQSGLRAHLGIVCDGLCDGGKVGWFVMKEEILEDGDVVAFERVDDGGVAHLGLLLLHKVLDGVEGARQGR